MIVLMNNVTKHFLFDGQAFKAITNIPGLPSQVAQKVGSVGEAYAAATYAYRCIHLRANSISQIPFRIKNSDGGEVKFSGWNWADKLPRLLWLTEASLCLHGAAYWFRSRNLVKTLNYRWLAPQTIKPTYDPNEGITGFRRVLSKDGKGDDLKNVFERLDSGVVPSSGKADYDLQDVVHFFLPDPEVEIGPGRSPTDVALEPIGLLNFINQFGSGFFERGAIPAVMLSVKGNVQEGELKRLEQWWRKLTRGVNRAWDAIAVRADVEPKVIGKPIKDLAMTELSVSMRGQIACAYGVPQTLLEDAANYGTAKTHRKSFYVETVIPSALLIQGVLNEQVFNPAGLSFEFITEELQIMQEEEAERSAALASLVGAGVPIIVALNILGFYVDESVLDDLELALSKDEGTDLGTLNRNRALLEAARLRIAAGRLDIARERQGANYQDDVLAQVAIGKSLNVGAAKAKTEVDPNGTYELCTQTVNSGDSCIFCTEENGLQEVVEVGDAPRAIAGPTSHCLTAQFGINRCRCTLERETITGENAIEYGGVGAVGRFTSK